LQCCASCGLTPAVHLYDLRDGGVPRHVWRCVECATFERGLGSDLVIAPVWIERAARNQLPVKELPQRHERRTFVTVDGFVCNDRRRAPRWTRRVPT
jgi:hypothetical protein